ncbi:MAG: [protein-PII] uridylyltransferase [Bradymonadia bacterium]
MNDATPTLPEGLAAYVARERDRIRHVHNEGTPGTEISAALSNLADRVVATLYEAACARLQHLDVPTIYTPPQILAIGGYGRQSLSPTSDLDLLFLTDHPVPEPGEGPEERDPVVDAVLHGLWDLRYKVGFATRTLEQTLDFAEEDLHTATALLTPRSLAGDPEMHHQLQAAYRQRFVGPRIDRLLEQLKRSMTERHERFGGSVYLLEPNLKHSPGGLRDLQLILWAAIMRFRINGWPEFLPRGVGSPREAKALFSARRFISRTRNALGYAHPHANDRLTFRHQETVAPALGFAEGGAGVEAFMAAWYKHASEVQKRARLVLERCIEMSHRSKRLTAHPVGEHFRLFNGQLTVASREVLQKHPVQAMKLFQVAQELKAPVYGSAKTRAMELAARLTGPDGDAWRCEPEVVQAFRSILSTPEDPHDALGDLHEVGLLGAILPEFGAVTHRTHHDLYHVYTVDIHTLHAIRKLKALHRGDLAEREPLLTEAMRLIEAPFSLYLGLLMHDAGKALGRGHAVKGARLLPVIARRWAMATAEAREAEWLVRDHLVMAHISQRRDLDDEHIIQRFARRVGSVDALSKLFVLTWADASTTGPQAYTDWKAALLAQLYLRTRQLLGRGLGLFDDPERRVARLRRVVSDALERQGRVVLKDVNGEVDTFFQSLPTPYFRRTLARDIARHFEMARQLKAEPPVVVQVDARPRGDICRLHIAAPDQPGLLSIIAGVLTAQRLEILGAALNSTDGGVALDVFEVRPTDGEVRSAEDPRWDEVQAALADVISGDTTVERLLGSRHQRPTGPRPSRRPSDERGAQISVDEEASKTYTVIDVQAPDRVGLLYDMTRALAEAGVHIYLARVTTEGDQAFDTFYVCAPDGAALDAEAIEEATGALLAVLGDSA